jgi:acyl-coenzyme A thioesterase PaaI-like protein
MLERGRRLMSSDSDVALARWNERGADKFPGHLGIVFSRVTPTEVIGEFVVRGFHMAPNGFLHAGAEATQSVVAVKPEKSVGP